MERATTGTRSGVRKSRRARLVSLIVGATAALALCAAPAAFGGIQHEFAQFSDCPTSNPEVVLCVISTTTSGEFHLGSKTVPISLPVILQGGLTASHVLVPAVDGNTLSKTALPVPGGLVGIELLPPLTSVTATAELAGQVLIDPSAANSGQGVAAVLPVKVKLDNPLLGASCRVGSDAEPLTPNLTTGTTSPPSPNTPITGNPGKIVIGGHGQLFTITGASLVDNAFAAPGANGCVEPLGFVVDVGVDLATGLPSAAGTNTAILNGNLAAASVTAVNAQAALPELGRCVKVPGERLEKSLVYHGGYVDSGCVEKNEGHFGKFEWTPGAGAGKKFTGESKAVTLETTGGAKVKCLGSTSHGEYTGTKTATLGLTLTGCTLAGESCQTSTATPGQISTAPLSAQLGFIKDTESEGQVTSIVGWDLQAASSVISAECGAGKQSLVVTGSVIGTISGADKMLAAYTLKFAQTAGKQLPEAFEEEAKDTLSAAFGGAPAEQTGLKASEKIKNEEKHEFKAQAET
jgi:hypothetical protein